MGTKYPIFPKRRRRPTEPALRALRVAVAHHQQQLALLEQIEPLNYGVGDVFQAATSLERDQLAALLGTRRSSPRALVAALTRSGGRLETPVACAQQQASRRRRRGYEAMVRRVGCGLGASPSLTTVEVEAQIIASAFGRLVDNLTPATMTQLAVTQRALIEALAPDLNRRITAALFASIARASGFNLFFMGSSVRSSVAAALDLPSGEDLAPELGRAALARLGWQVLAPWGLIEGVVSQGAPDALVVLLVATIRQRLAQERGEQIRRHRLSLQRDLSALERF